MTPLILVTGGAGYLGSHIVKRLVGMDQPVRVLIRDRERAHREGRLAGLELDLIEGDVRRPETLTDAFKGATTIIHTVAIAIERGGQTYEDVNYQGTVNAVDAAVASQASRFINISQLGAASDLPYRFLASKGKAQNHVRRSSLDWTAFRPSVIWGPEDEFANTFARLARITPLIFPIVGDESTVFQPVWVEDVVTCVTAALKDPETIGHEFELGGPEILTLEEIERRTLNAIGARRLLIPFPMWMLRLAVSMMELVLPAPPVTRSLLELLAVSNVTQQNALPQFVKEPQPFAIEKIKPYMKTFRTGDTLKQFLGG